MVKLLVALIQTVVTADFGVQLRLILMAFTKIGVIATWIWTPARRTV